MTLKAKKNKLKRLGLNKMEMDHTERAYREAVAKLKFLLSESYSQPPEVIYSHTHHHHHVSPLSRSPRSRFDTSTLSIAPGPIVKHPSDSSLATVQAPPHEFVSYIQRQEDYIQQLEKEKSFFQEEMSTLMNKVKEVLVENENLRRDKKLQVNVSSSEDSGSEETVEEKPRKKRSQSQERPHSRLASSNIVLESKISELEAQLMQTKIDLQKAQEEVSSCKMRPFDSEPRSLPLILDDSSGAEANLKDQINLLQREKDELHEALIKLQLVVSHLEKTSMVQKVKSLDVVDQAQFEKNQAELEVRRLMAELERAHEKQREAMQEQNRLRQDAERRYNIQLEKLTSDLQEQWDHTGKLSLELDRQHRLENELRRELNQKISFIDELKKELTAKTCNLQSEALSASAEKESLERELASAKLSTERNDRANKQEIQRLQAEVTSLRQRLDRADVDLLHSRKETIRLKEQIASLEKELNLTKLESVDRPSALDGKREDLSAMIKSMDAKHLQNIADLESMIETQTELMDKLKDECQNLTLKLDETSSRHKEEVINFNEFNDGLMSRLNHVWSNCHELRRLCEVHGIYSFSQMSKWSESMPSKTTHWTINETISDSFAYTSLDDSCVNYGLL
ncbi:serologically defined colon cancer antigen 8 homolog isoform X3 [Bemisia tabaci]|uniref:serologically defined colon cancer antigen 8 homolog isoform X3 n=1 Tax=Bemisia tabaci TaxID=7038 RepID=UPI0008F9A0D5|nr:PREDICTED: serologically defined colon cancer antigen 8 homolog isoform X3 [Bemisia tabaci]